MSEKKFKLSARVSSATPSAIKAVLERMIANNGSIKPTDDGFEVKAEFKGECAKDLNRMLLTEMRRAEKKTRLRSEWTARARLKSILITCSNKRKK